MIVTQLTFWREAIGGAAELESDVCDQIIYLP